MSDYVYWGACYCMCVTTTLRVFMLRVFVYSGNVPGGSQKRRKDGERFGKERDLQNERIISTKASSTLPIFQTLSLSHWSIMKLRDKSFLILASLHCLWWPAVYASQCVNIYVCVCVFDYYVTALHCAYVCLALANTSLSCIQSSSTALGGVYSRERACVYVTLDRSEIISTGTPDCCCIKNKTHQREMSSS